MKKMKTLTLALLLIFTMSKSHAGVLIGSLGAMAIIAEVGRGDTAAQSILGASVVGGIAFGLIKVGQNLMKINTIGGEPYHAGAMMVVLDEKRENGIKTGITELFPFLSDDITLVQELNDLLLSKYPGEGIVEVKLTEEEITDLIQRADLSDQNVQALKKQLM